MSTGRRRPWWLSGRTVPGTVAGMAATFCLPAALLSVQLTGRSADRDPTFLQQLVWLMVTFAVLGAVAGASTIRALRRHPEWERQPANPMQPDRARIWWSISSALALIGVLGLVPIVMGVRGALTWLQPGAALAAYFILLTLANRTGRQAAANTQAPA